MIIFNSLVFAQSITAYEGQSFSLCGVELRITETWVHQHKPYISLIFENHSDTFAVTYGEKIPLIPCDLYVEDIQKIGKQPAKVQYSSKLKEGKSLNVINKMVLKNQKLYEINGIFVTYQKKGNIFEFELNEKYKIPLELKNILWIGQNAFALTNYQKDELTLVRIVELLVYKNDTLYQLANEELPYSQAFIEQIVLLPKPNIKKNLEDFNNDDYQICLVKIYLEPVNFQTKKDRFLVNGKEKEYPYSIIKVFSNKKEALDYAYKNNINEVFID